MAKVNTNALIKALSGSLGGLVFCPMPDGSVIVSMPPNFSRRKFSKGQKDHQRRFREAVAYARQAAKTQPIYAELAKGTMKTAYNIALSDWFNPPVIHRVERHDNEIIVQASDNVRVAKVVVKVLDEEGTVLEKGKAWQQQGDCWVYASQRTGKMVIAEAYDLAGNVVRFEIEYK
jgi:hypothetical protein